MINLFIFFMSFMFYNLFFTSFLTIFDLMDNALQMVTGHEIICFCHFLFGIGNDSVHLYCI